jgi:gluconokinase
MSLHPFRVLSLDIGTSSVRAILYDALGQPAGAGVQTPYEMQTSPDGGVFIDADRLVDIVSTTLDRLCGQPLRPPVQSVAVTTFWHNLVGVGPDDRAVTPLISWADTRPGTVMPALRERLDERATHARTGCMLHPSYLPAKLLWFSQEHPSLFSRAERWMSIGEYLLLRYFGRTVCSVSMASGTGLFNPRTCVWDAETLAALPVREAQLSPLVDLDQPLTGLGDAFGRRWPALREVPWWPAVGDGACSNIGSGCVTGRRLALMVGTSGAMRVMWSGSPGAIPAGLWCYRADRRRVLMGGALSNGGNVYGWMRETLRLGAETEIEQAVAGMEPDAHGLTILPFWAGERSPGWHASARATIAGMTLHTRPIDLMRAALEATAYCFAAIHDRLQAVHPDLTEIVASGGGLLQSPAWMQMMADVLGQPVTASAVPEASSRGAALLASEASGALADLAKAPVPLDVTYEPDRARHARYRDAMARQQRLYDLMMA